MKKIKIGIVGGAGYTGGELLRILIHHPMAEIVFVHSKSNAGKYIYETHTDLLGDTDLKFSSEYNTSIDVLFLCMGHGESNKFLTENPVFDNIKKIDLSQDYRLNESSAGKWVYGLPELNRDKIKQASNIANPGCFATCIQLGLLPLASKQKLNDEIHLTATTGSTGAGQSLSATSHFSWRANNLSVYKAFEHQHLNEINQSLQQLQSSYNKELNFIPNRGNFTRGILASIYLNSDLSAEEATSIYKEYYKDHPFVHISDQTIDLKQVVNTNKCLLNINKHGNKIFITSIIDNLLKGASGQAVQNMNLMFGQEETMGLKLKPSAF